MTDKTKSPSRMAGYAETMRGLVARDGLVCFLCGHKHATVHTMQGDMRNPDNGFELENLVITCKPCAKRRNGKRIGAYWRERKSAAAAEIAHINMMVEDQEVLRTLSATLSLVPHAVDGTGQTETVEAKPWDGIKPTLFLRELMRQEDFRSDMHVPKMGKHGDVYQYEDVQDGTIQERVFDGGKGKWVDLPKAQERGDFPKEWPPADAAVWRQ
jgi:hypothetical protein